MTTLHEDELFIDPATVRALVDRDFPGHEDLVLRPLGATGSTNLLFRLGTEFLVRLPRQPGNGESIHKEVRWGSVIGRTLPVATPEIIGLGEPGFGFPEPWSVVRWIDGRHPELAGGPSQAELARDLAAVIAALRSAEVSPEALADPTLRWYRGQPLATRDAGTRQTIQQCRSIADLDLDLDAALRIWDEAMRLPGVDTEVEPRWYHGDLLAENLLVTGNRLTAVLDFGSLSIGDPTIDLHGAWELFDEAARTVFRTELGVDEAEWLRGRAWALATALGTFTYYWDTMPERRASRLAMARAILADGA
ncbi:MAG: aminoglycoside phosphotransferase family protein [Microlunatus sp.]|nr:aminoglycoside phosphotransferase family protein [Microlunatus sp.]